MPPPPSGSPDRDGGAAVKELLETYDAWRAAGLDVGRAIVIRAFGSAPRTEGATLLVAADGRMIGSVSGGCVEGAAAEAVLEAQRTGHSRVIRYGISDEQAWGVGLACGGTIDVLVEPAVADTTVRAARASTTDAGRLGFAVATLLPADTPPPTVGPAAAYEAGPPRESELLEIEGREAEAGASTDRSADTPLHEAARAAVDRGRSGIVDLADGPRFIEVFPSRPRLVVVGATEVARWLVGFARPLGYLTVVIDARAAFATPERFPDVDRLVQAWPDEAFDAIELGPTDAVAVLSHDPKLDEPAIVEAVRRGARYVGAVGSRKTQSARRAALLSAGLTAEEIGTVRGPIGLDLGGREPSETALAIIAEIVATHRGGTGLPLRERAGTVPSAVPVGSTT